MRKLFTLFIFVMAAVIAAAQVPQGINYQAVARNASNVVLATQSIGVRVSIIDGTPTGTVQYAETFSTITNQFGLFNIVIGSGNVSAGTFGSITWSAGNKFIKVEVDPTGGTTYIDMGTTRFQSVPYALYAPVPAPPPPALNGTRNYVVKNDGTNLGINSSVWDSAGRVGIGNTRPASVLDVSGNIYTSSKNADTISAHAVSNRDSTRFGQVSGQEFVGMELKVEPYLCGNGGIIRFKTWGCNTSVSREVMRINELGNVAIGTTAPTAKLEVAGAILGSGNQSNHIQGAYLEWNKDGTTGHTYLLNNKGLGSGGLIIGEVNNANVITERININGSGNVGIGTSNPTAQLDVVGSVFAANFSSNFAGDRSTLVGIKNNNAAPSQWYVAVGGTNNGLGLTNDFYIEQSGSGSRLNINSSGNVGIGTAAPGVRLDVNASAVSNAVCYIRNTGNNSSTFNDGMHIIAGSNTWANVGFSAYIGFHKPDGTWIGGIQQSSASSIAFSTTSDARLKTNIHDTKYGLKDLLNIQVSDYYYKDDLKSEQTGFIAQQLIKYYPIAVIPGGDDPKVKPFMVDYGKLTPLLVKSMQEQQKQIEKQQTQIEKQQAQIEELKRMMEGLKAQGK